MAQRLGTPCERDGAQPSLRLRRAAREKRRVWHPQHDLLRADALQGGVRRARHTLLAPKGRIIQKAIRGYRLGPAMTGGWHPADGPHAQPVSQPSAARRMPGIVPLALREFFLYPVVHRHAPLHGFCRAL